MDIIEKLGITKGPWEINESSGDYFVRNIEGDNIAVASDVYPEGAIPIDEKDALLIAAAPEMFCTLIKNVKAVEKILYEVKPNLWSNVRHELDVAYSEGKDAIGKATGRTWEEIKKLL